MRELDSPPEESRRSRAGGNAPSPGGGKFIRILVAQLILCLLLAGGGFFIKIYSSELYGLFHQNLMSMISESTVLNNLFEQWTNFKSKLPEIQDNFVKPFEQKTQQVLNELEDKIGRQMNGDTQSEPASGESEPDSAEQNSEMSGAAASDAVSAQAMGGEGIALPSAEQGGQTLPDYVTRAPYYLSATPTAPVDCSLTSGFDFRTNPITGKDEFHPAADLAAPKGTRIAAFFSGRVEQVGENEVFGRFVLLRHSAELLTFYAHCSEVLVSEGMLLRQGETLALVGDTGYATGPHLHFEIRLYGKRVDPMYILSRLQSGDTKEAS